jgi:release factor glutamine methyltransferase
MTTLPAFPSFSSITARLRAAGCVFAEDEARLLVSAAATPADLDAMVERRAAGSPLEHVLGWAEFCGLRIAVGDGVFVPRPRTEHLVRQAAALAPARAVAVDLCCGSGALGAALAAHADIAELHAADIDPAALRYARRNLPATTHVHQGDLYAALPGALRGRVHILIANVPYVPTGEIPLLPAEARLHEPQAALDGGHDGLDVLRRLAEEAPGWLAPGGLVAAGLDEEVAADATAILSRAGLTPHVCTSADPPATVVIARRP